MKFGLESEKLLFDQNDQTIYHGVFRLVDALSDYVSFHGEHIPERITNEFVLNMVEMNTLALPSPREVMADYLLLYLIVRDVSKRDNVVQLPLSAVPFHFTPSMVPKWPYYVQNSILSGKRLKEWTLSADSPLADAGNCAGIHAHFEIETLPEFLAFNSELVSKHNFALMLTPIVAFSASPYFLSEHRANSMRSKRYYNGVYANFPQNGSLPPVFDTSEEVLRYSLESMETWIAHGLKLGFKEDDLRKLTAKKGANWSMLRWNRSWNTIELRCIESDRIDLDLAKFTWVSGAMTRLDLKGERLIPRVARPLASLDEEMIEAAFTVEGETVTILSTSAIHELTQRAIDRGLGDPWVARYLERLAEFARVGVEEECLEIFSILERELAGRTSTATRFLAATGGKEKLTMEECLPIIRTLIEEDRAALKNLLPIFPGTIPRDTSTVFPSMPRSKKKS